VSRRRCRRRLGLTLATVVLHRSDRALAAANRMPPNGLFPRTGANIGLVFVSGGSRRTSELWRLSAVELAQCIARKEVSSAEVIDAHLARIDAVNPAVNAVVHVLGDQARALARQSDRRLVAGERLGVLHGVPFTVKENIDMAATIAQYFEPDSFCQGGSTTSIAQRTPLRGCSRVTTLLMCSGFGEARWAPDRKRIF